MAVTWRSHGDHTAVTRRSHGGHTPQAGFELNTVLLILNTAEALEAFMGSAQLTLGANLSVAVGPIGRHAEATGVAGTYHPHLRLHG